jgi:hypothetical protein
LRHRGRHERGQALTELILVAPLFAGLMLLFAFWAHLGVARLAMVQLSRDAALMLARNGTLWSQPLKVQEAAVRDLARRQALLDPASLTLLSEEVAPVGLGNVEALQGALNSPLGQSLIKLAGLRRYRLRCRLKIGGLAGRLVGGGVNLEESLVLQGDPWKMEASELMSKILR